jgi:hypothetical protein
MKLTGENQSTRGKTCPNATLSTTNLTWTDLGSNPGLRGESPATNRVSHGTALKNLLQLKASENNVNNEQSYMAEHVHVRHLTINAICHTVIVTVLCEGITYTLRQ